MTADPILAPDAFDPFVRSTPTALDAHLQLVKRDVLISGTKTQLHCYFPRVDGNGRVRVERLIEHMRDRVIDYAIPRRRIEEARRYDAERGTTVAMMRLTMEAMRLFTNLKKSGEGGELLLFTLAESILGYAQLLCKMSLKTSAAMHYHGADGVYSSIGSDGSLHVHWGESKVMKDPKAAIRACLESLRPYLTDPDSEAAARDRDLLLVNEFANFDDPQVVAGLKRFLDPEDPASNQLRYSGVALVAFDGGCYPADDIEAVADTISQQIGEALDGWSDALGRRVSAERLDRFDIHFFCIPVPSAKGFRDAFRSALRFDV